MEEQQGILVFRSISPSGQLRRNYGKTTHWRNSRRIWQKRHARQPHNDDNGWRGWHHNNLSEPDDSVESWSNNVLIWVVNIAISLRTTVAAQTQNHRSSALANTVAATCHRRGNTTRIMTGICSVRGNVQNCITGLERWHGVDYKRRTSHLCSGLDDWSHVGRSYDCGNRSYYYGIFW